MENLTISEEKFIEMTDQIITLKEKLRTATLCLGFMASCDSPDTYDDAVAACEDMIDDARTTMRDIAEVK